MARIRSIHPNTPTDPDLALQPVEGRLMFIYSLTIADDAGNLERNPLGLKMALFPADEWATVERMTVLTEGLIVGRFYVPYEADGKKYLHFRNFAKYQKLDHPTAPRFPLLPGQEYTYHARKKGNKFEVRTAKGPPLPLTAPVPHTNDPLTLGVLQRRTGLDRTGLEGKEEHPRPSATDADGPARSDKGNGPDHDEGIEDFLLHGILDEEWDAKKFPDKVMIPEAMVSVWNSIIDKYRIQDKRVVIPLVQRLTPDRRKKCAARIKELDLRLGQWAAIVHRIGADDFHAGVTPSPKNPNWKATFNWTIETDKRVLGFLEDADFNGGGATP